MLYADTINVPMSVKCEIKEINGTVVIHSISFPGSPSIIFEALPLTAQNHILATLATDGVSACDDQKVNPFKVVS